MTLKQIKFILTENDVPSDTWIQLDKYIPLIILSQENNIHVNKSAVYRFNHEQELLEVVFGSYVKPLS